MKCPGCGGEEWYEGPGCGGAQNIQCAGCGDHYNNTPFGLEFICHDRLPYIKNSLTGKEESLPTIGAAMEEATRRNKELVPNSTAETLAACECWFAHDGKGTLMTDIVPAWRHFHPGRPLT